MGVLECDREGCENILCDRYNSKHGHICEECFEELVKSGPETNITCFMNSVKKEKQGEEAEARARFEIVFPFREGWD